MVDSSPRSAPKAVSQYTFIRLYYKWHIPDRRAKETSDFSNNTGFYLTSDSAHVQQLRRALDDSRTPIRFVTAAPSCRAVHTSAMRLSAAVTRPAMFLPE